MSFVGDGLRGLKHPSLAIRELNRRLFDDRPMDGISVFEADWDNLVILDACSIGVRLSTGSPHEGFSHTFTE